MKLLEGKMIKLLCSCACLALFAAACSTPEDSAPVEVPESVESTSQGEPIEPAAVGSLLDDGAFLGEDDVGVLEACAVEGQLRYRSTSACCCNYDNPDVPKPRRRLLIDKCISGTWVYQGGVCDGQNCGGICPV